MSASKSLPARPSLDSLRKQAKKLVRDVAAGDSAAIARVRAQLRSVDAQFTQRNAQLVIAREYGFAGWQELTAEARQRLGDGLDWAVAQAERAIHDDDVELLRQLLGEFPSLKSWQRRKAIGNQSDSLLGMATSAYGDAGDTERERWFTRASCAELLLDAGAVVTRAVLDGLLQSRASGLLALFDRKGLLPRTLKFLAAVGDLDGVRAALDSTAPGLEAVNEAFVCACRFDRDAVAPLLLERSITLDPALGQLIDAGTGRPAFIKACEKLDSARVAQLGLWKVFVLEQVNRTVHERDLAGFAAALRRESWLLGDASVGLQAELLEMLAFQRQPREFVAAFLALDPAILRQRPPPPSRAIDWAFMYENTELLPLLTRIWPVPDGLAFAAGLGDLARVEQWFDAAGALRNPEQQYPYNDPDARSHLRWEPPTAQHVLDAALAFAVINRHLDVADFLLEHGADINTHWSTHEPASILHTVVFMPDNYGLLRFLVDRGIDMTIKDYRWNATARGWAFHALRDEKMAQWLGDAEAEQQRRARGAPTGSS
jgi:hypothetical protein